MVLRWLTAICSAPTAVPEQPVYVAPQPAPEQPVYVAPQPVPEQPVYVAPQPAPEQPAANPYPTYEAVPQPPVTTATEDKRSSGLNFLAFLFPIVGLILFLAMKNNTPIKAKSIGKWALIGFIVSTVATMFLLILIVVLAAMFA